MPSTGTSNQRTSRDPERDRGGGVQGSVKGTENPAAAPPEGIKSSIISSRAGYLPIPLGHAPPSILNGIPVYLKARPGTEDAAHGEAFTLYAGSDVSFNEDDRRRLADNNVKFVYLRIADQQRFQRQIEARLADIAEDPSIPAEEASTIIYETSVELINEVLSEPDLGTMSTRLDNVSRAVSALVISNEDAFSHLFATSCHDFYTATHMVNVAAWMVPIAYEMGYRDPEELKEICQAGLLHDIGKVYIPPEILNKKEKLADEEMERIRKHPALGHGHLKKSGSLPELVSTVAIQHHERQDGSGYPSALTADDIHPVSKICAVVDSFDAMTAFRPFKDRTLNVSEAIAAIQDEKPAKYDAQVVDVWLRLMNRADPALTEKSQTSKEQRVFARHSFRRPARVHILKSALGGWQEQPGFQVVAHNISRSGIGFLSQIQVTPGEQVRIYVQVRSWTRDYLDGIVMRCRSHQDGWYEVGVKFALAGPDPSSRRSGTNRAPTIGNAP